MIAFLSVALGSGAAAVPDAVEVKEGETVQVEGPRVVLSDHQFRRYVIDRRLKEKYKADYESAMDSAFESNQRLLEVTKTCKEQFSIDERVLEEIAQQGNELGLKLEKRERQLSKVRNQRNLLLVSTVGLVATGAGALSLAVALN